MEHRLRLIGTWGAILTLAVVAASALLRLATSLDAAGSAASILPPAIESLARLAHRASATGVAILALLAAYVVATSRPVARGRICAVAAVVLLTLFLAAIGRYTTGYRHASVTVGNVTSGIALACAFWWLRVKSTAAPVPARREGVLLAMLALAAVLAQSGLGAAASAGAMRGERMLEPFHVFGGLAILGLAVGCAARRPGNGARAPAVAIACVAALQLAIGLFLAGTGHARPIAAEWAHAMLSGALALALVSFAAR